MVQAAEEFELWQLAVEVIMLWVQRLCEAIHAVVGVYGWPGVGQLLRLALGQCAQQRVQPVGGWVCQ
jgi:TorA maturation chaperone TorD